MSDTSKRGSREGRHYSQQQSHSRGGGRRPFSRPSSVESDNPRLVELEREEPLSIAEELDKAAERVRRVGKNIERTDKPDPNIHIAALQKMGMPELIEIANDEGVEEAAGLKKQDLIFRILKQRVKLDGMMSGEGTLEILPDGFGFLRSPDYHYLSCPDDIYVSPSQIRRFGLRTGATVAGTIRPPKENERYFALLRIESINGDDPNTLSRKVFFDNLTPMHPEERIRMEINADEVAMRVVDMIVPIGFGQRGLIVSPPRAGKTILMQKMAKSVLANYPDAHVVMLLIDERPEEVTDMEREVKGPNCEVISSTFDEPAARHIQVADMVIEKAKRMVEYGRDVVIFLDSITRLARAWNSECPHSGKVLSGGIDANAMQRPKRFLRLGSQGRRGRFADDYRHGTDRHGQPHGRSDLRRVQRDGQSGDRARPRPGRQADLAGDRHQPQRHAPRRDADGPRRIPPHLPVASRAQRNESPRRDGPADHAAAEDAVECGILDEHQGIRRNLRLRNARLKDSEAGLRIPNSEFVRAERNRNRRRGCRSDRFAIVVAEWNRSITASCSTARSKRCMQAA